MTPRFGSSMLVFFLFVLPVASQENGTVQKNAIGNGSTYTINGQMVINGSNGNSGDAPPVLQVVGGASEVDEGAGAAITLAAGTGGVGEDGGSGGTVTIIAGTGGYGFPNPGIGGNIVLQPGAAGDGDARFAGNLLFVLPTGGMVGVGTKPTATLDVGQGLTTLADHWTTRSARRFKTNIQPLQGALEKVERLQGVSYENKADGKREIGVVAEDVGQVVPELVSHDSRTNEVQGVDYSRLAALLIEAVKTQQAELRSQQTEIRHLKAQIAQLALNQQSR